MDIYVEAGYAKKRKDGKYRFLRTKHPVPSVERLVKKDISKILDKLIEEDRTSFSIKDIKSRLPYDISEQMIGKIMDRRLFPQISTRHFSLEYYKELKEEKEKYYIPISHEPEYHAKGHIIVQVLRHDEKKLIMQPDELADILKVIVEE